MKKLIYLSAFALFFSCEDVIDIDLEPNTPQLVVEANLNCFDNASNCPNPFVNLTLSTDFFAENQRVPVDNASVNLLDLTTNTTIPYQNIANGLYAPIGLLDLSSQGEFELRINYDGDLYTARERYFTTPVIDSITNSREAGFDDEAIEVTVFWKDDGATEDFYTVRFSSDKGNELDATSDEFSNGNTLFNFFEQSNTFDEEVEEFEPGDEVRVRIFRNSQRFNSFLTLLLDQSEAQGPFPVTPAPLIGNIVNTTRPEKRALGYFRLGQVQEETHTIVE